ncbi:MAG: TolC family protein [Crocinitomicaceae bacterium]|nr:TolC family protein [Crocinitomicaceae bacterium]
MLRVFTLFLTGIPLLLHSQDTLTLEAAVKRALEKNYDVLMVKNTTDIAHLNNAAGNAGMLPRINWQVSDNLSRSDIYQRFATGNEISSKNAVGNNLGAGIAFDWTIFDGFKMFSIRDKLKSLDEQGQIQLRKQMASTVEAVTSAYVKLATAEQQRKNVNDVIAFNEEREKIALARFKAGTFGKADWLQAKIDLNNQLQQRIEIQTDIFSARRELEMLLVFPEESEFSVGYFDDDLAVDMEELERSLPRNNYDLLIAEKNRQIAELSIREAESVRMPRIGLTGAYNFTNVNNSAGFSLLNRSYGPTAGLTLSMPLFNGGTGNRSIQTAKIQTHTAQLLLSAITQRINADFKIAKENYKRLSEVKILEEENAVLAREFLEISTERFRQGQTTSLGISQAQVTYQNSITRLAQCEYDLSLAKVKLLLIAGKI